MNGISETETVVKRILPYLHRRGYDLQTDLSFEFATNLQDRYQKGYVDILVVKGNKPLFLVEAKRQAKKLNAADHNQALTYGASIGVPFVVVTNGVDLQTFNTKTKKAIRWNGKLEAHIPTKTDLPKVLIRLKSEPELQDIYFGDHLHLPFRPGLPLKQLNKLFQRCHNIIRNIEKDEDHSFSDFSKLLFLKLLEEKADIEQDFSLKYSYTFAELADYPINKADQVKTAIISMLSAVRGEHFGDIVLDEMFLKQAKTYQLLVKELSKVSFADSGLDTKGAAFEYFVRATLKGKKLGQYFTPRPLVELMMMLVGREMIVSSLLTGSRVKVLDPACGTGGFLVYALKSSLEQVKGLREEKKITAEAYTKLVKSLKEEVFFGGDANEGVASAAKMNMVIAGDGHTNIRHEDTLQSSARIWSLEIEDVDIILTNPPFGTTETDSLNANELSKYPIRTSKGQYLFLEKMMMSTKPGGQICTVIDEGLLNTGTGKELRRWLLSWARLKAVIQLPDTTFQPNKINVKSSVLLFEKRTEQDHDLEDEYLIRFCRIASLGYDGTGDMLRGFNIKDFILRTERAINTHEYVSNKELMAFSIKLSELSQDVGCRYDLKYWEPEILKFESKLEEVNSPRIKEINTIETSRGKSPSSELYVDKEDGFAVVIKAGSNVRSNGLLDIEDADWIEKDVYDTLKQSCYLEKGDVLVSSTGDGTLGKVAVFDLDVPAIADGHVAIIRPDKSIVDSYYLCDYLRIGNGKRQIQRLFTGSTGLIELTPTDLDRVLIDLEGMNTTEQRNKSKSLREAEIKHSERILTAHSELLNIYSNFSR